jgi:hypothetical protein
MGGRNSGGWGNSLEEAAQRLSMLEQNPQMKGKYGIKQVRPGKWSVLPIKWKGVINPFGP